MAVIREFAGGRVDLQGGKTNTLLIGDFISRNPLRWRTKCERCGSEGSDSHDRLVSGAAVCRSQGCGKQSLRDDLRDTPTKYQKRIEADEAREREAAEEAEAQKIADLKSAFEDTSRKIASTIRERISTQRDDEVYVDPATIGITLSLEAANKFNGEQSALFISEHPDYHATVTNWQTLSGYFERNEIRILSVPTIAAAVKRLNDYGLLEHRPAPTPTPRVNLTTEHESEPEEPATPQQSAPEKFIGFDTLTGLEREYSNYEVGRMTSSEFRRIFRLKRSDFDLPNVGPRSH